MNFVLSFWVPAVVVGVYGYLKHSLIEIHHGILSLLAGQYVPLISYGKLKCRPCCYRSLTTLITLLGKHLIGELLSLHNF